MKVSVIIPVYNAERFIQAALESVFRQRDTAPELELEVIVVDNGSTDSSLALIEQRFGAAVVVAHEPRQGASFARNKGIGLATAPFLAFLDADDLWFPGKLQMQCAILREKLEVAMVFCLGDQFSDPPGAFPAVHLPQAYHCTGALLARREVFDRAGLFPEFRCGEFIAWFGWTQTLELAAHTVAKTFFSRRIHAWNTTRDRQLMLEYPQAMRWLLERRRLHAAGNHCAP